MRNRLDNKGQTSVEYILMIAAIVAVMYPLFSKIQYYVVDSQNSMIKRYISSFEKIFAGPGGGTRLKYKRFVIRR